MKGNADSGKSPMSLYVSKSEDLEDFEKAARTFRLNYQFLMDFIMAKKLAGEAWEYVQERWKKHLIE
jgi:hypothetical protein